MATESTPDDLIKEHVACAMAASAIPIPLIDVGAVAGVQLDLVKSLAHHHDVKHDDDAGKALVSALVGASLARYGASALKTLPGIGSLVGGVAQAVLSGASTWALGHAFSRHFEGVDTMAGMPVEELRRAYETSLDRGRKIAEALWERMQPASHERVDAVADTLERLVRLRDAGILSRDEFQLLRDATVEAAD